MTISPLLGLPFSLYVAFAIFCVLNIVTGVFVENANKITFADTQTRVMEEIASHQEKLTEIQRVFQMFDHDESGGIDLEEFTSTADDVTVQAYFRKIGLNVE